MTPPPPLFLPVISLPFTSFLHASSLPTLRYRYPFRLHPQVYHPVAQLNPDPPPNPPPNPPTPPSDLLSRLDTYPDEPELSSRALSDKLTNSSSQLLSLLQYIRYELSTDVDIFLSSPVRVALSSALSLLFGFFSATSASTIIGSVADWDPLAAAVLLVWTESFTKYYYANKAPSRILQLINAFKIGLIYGMTIDAFKLST